MNQQIINSLIQCKQSFDKKYQHFAFKQDLDAVFQHEYENYLMPLCENIIPQLYKELKNNPEIKIEDYFPYISPKYHDFVGKEISNYEKNNQNQIKNIGKEVIEKFSQNLISHAKTSPEEQEEILRTFFQEHLHIIKKIIQKDPLYGLELTSQLRNPKFQNMLITKFEEPFKTFIQSKNPHDFHMDILPFFTYPAIGLEEYYHKWIGRAAFHVKFSKNILGNHYEKAKIDLKKIEINRINEQRKNN